MKMYLDYHQVIFVHNLQKADVNGDGFLEADEYYKILKDHGVDCTKEEILHIMAIADKDHDGYGKSTHFTSWSPCFCTLLFFP